MINQTSYEVFGAPLAGAAENVVFMMADALLKLNKRMIKDTNNAGRWRQLYEKELSNIANQFSNEWKVWADEDLAKAYLAGVKQAQKQLTELGKNSGITNDFKNGSFLIEAPPPIPPIPPIPGQVIDWFENYPNHTSFFGVFRAAAYYNLEGQHLQIIRAGRDLYRDVAVMAGELNFKEGDIFTRRKLSQTMLNEFAKKGVQTITYKNGARYSIDSYCEMVGRSMTGRAAVQASLNRYAQSGYTLFIVSSHFRACDLCTPYENRILSLEKHPVYESIDDATTQGLFHARCSHDVTAWFEGLTQPKPPRVHSGEQQLIDEYGYKKAQEISYQAQQKQRYIERNIRNWKRRKNVSLSEVEKQRAKKKIREWQAKQREHLKENAFLPRKYTREQVKKAY